MIFEQYVAERGQDLLRLAYVLTRDAQLAEDLVQTVLVDIYKKWGKVQAASNTDAYVRRMMVNAYLMWRRRRSWFERPLRVSSPNTVNTAPDPAVAVARNDQTRRLLLELSPKARTVLVLRYYVDLDDATIADLLGISASTVRATASRALDRLRPSRSARSVSMAR